MFTIKVKLYDPLRRLIGKREMKLKVEEGSTVEDIIHQLVKMHNFVFKKIFLEYSIGFSYPYGNTLFILVNGSNIYLLKEQHKHKLSDGDIISLIPVVSGG